MKFAVAILVLVSCLMPSCEGFEDMSSKTPVKIGVLMSMSGPSDIGYRHPLEWARDNINRAGGIGGRPLELVYKDLGVLDTDEAAAALLADDTIAAVIGADTSRETFHR